MTLQSNHCQSVYWFSMTYLISVNASKWPHLSMRTKIQISFFFLYAKSPCLGLKVCDQIDSTIRHFTPQKSRFWYQKKAHIFLITVVNFRPQLCFFRCYWLISTKMWLPCSKFIHSSKGNHKPPFCRCIQSTKRISLKI